MNQARQEKLRMATRYFYDIQKLRMQTNNRAKSETAELEDDDQTFLTSATEGLTKLEAEALKEVKRWLKGTDVYERWLNVQKGCGPTMSAVILSEVSMCRQVDPDYVDSANYSDEFKIEGFTYFRMRYTQKTELLSGEKREVEKDLLCFHREGKDGTLEVWEDCCPTVSSLWAYCGLSVDTKTGKAVRRQKGVKSNWNPFVKTKMVGVLADCLLRCNSPWRDHYDNFKHRWESQGKGSSDGHRHNAAKRYMVKMFLRGLYIQWREQEGLPVRAPYAEEYGVKTHHEGPAAIAPPN